MTSLTALDLSRLDLEEMNRALFTVFPNIQTLNLSDSGVDRLHTEGLADRVYLGTYLWEDNAWRQSAVCEAAGFLFFLSMETSVLFVFLVTLEQCLALIFPSEGVLDLIGISIPVEVNVAVTVFVMPANAALNPFLYAYSVRLEKARKAREDRLQRVLLSRLKNQNKSGNISQKRKAAHTRENALELVAAFLKDRLISTAQVKGRLLAVKDPS
nr:hypothetical protein BaRGS_008263 [Batillaria attramentaria]